MDSSFKDIFVFIFLFCHRLVFSSDSTTFEDIFVVENYNSSVTLALKMLTWQDQLKYKPNWKKKEKLNQNNKKNQKLKLPFYSNCSFLIFISLHGNISNRRVDWRMMYNTRTK
jgi:hypothetical protein